MGALGLLFLAIGAVLYWGVSADAAGVDVDLIGIVLMIVGLIGLVVGLVQGTFLNIRSDRRTVSEEHHVDETRP